MVKVVEKNVEAIKELCKRMQIQSLYLFGSGISEKNLPVKAILIFCFNLKKINRDYQFQDMINLMFGLEKIKGEKVDLVAEDKVKNKFFLSTVNKEKIKIYES